MKIINLLKNKLDINEEKNFTAIIGSNPSKGARSPLLWNYTFNKNNIDCKMHCFDVEENNIEEVINQLRNNNFFLGGAIAVPYKERIFDLLKNNVTPEAKNIGSINCLFRNNNGDLCGTNTDGEASVLALKEKTNKINGKKILLIGPGGAGKAVSAYILKAMERPKDLYISGRSKKTIEFCKKINCNFIEWHSFETVIDDFDIIINCSTLGHGELMNLSPISLEGVKKIKKSALIYDIIYDPSPTKLLTSAINRNINTLDGKKMNLLQASLAFDYCIRSSSRNFITFELMSEEFNKIN